MPDQRPSDTQWVILSLMSLTPNVAFILPRPKPDRGSAESWARRSHDWILQPYGHIVTKRTIQIASERGWIRKSGMGWSITSAGIKAPLSRKPPRYVADSTRKTGRIETVTDKLNSEAREYFRKQGARGGKLGAKARMEKLTPEQRSEIARNAVAAREQQRAERNGKITAPSDTGTPAKKDQPKKKKAQNA